jgi:hypothetical protein
MSKGRPLPTPQDLRRRAAEMRRLAEYLHSPQAQERTLKLAEEYEAHALAAEHILQSKDAPPESSPSRKH